jgi:hypothetical protein
MSSIILTLLLLALALPRLAVQQHKHERAASTLPNRPQATTRSYSQEPQRIDAVRAAECPYYIAICQKA